MKRSEFLKLLGAAPLLENTELEADTTPKLPERCPGCDTKLIKQKCIHTKYCYACRTYRHFIENRCEECNNGDIPIYSTGIFTSSASCTSFNPPIITGYNSFHNPMGNRLTSMEPEKFANSRYDDMHSNGINTKFGGFGTTKKK